MNYRISIKHSVKQTKIIFAIVIISLMGISLVVKDDIISSNKKEGSYNNIIADSSIYNNENNYFDEVKEWKLEQHRQLVEKRQNIEKDKKNKETELEQKYAILKGTKIVASRGGGSGIERYSFVNGEKPEIKAILWKEAEDHDVPITLLYAVAMIETEGGINVSTSEAGAKGVMQITASTARSLGIKDRTNPYQNICGGAKYLRSLLDMFQNKVVKDVNRNIIPTEVLAGMGYNMGGENLNNKIKNNILNINTLPSETRGYYKKLRMYYP